MKKSFGETLFTNRITEAKPSFIREILKTAVNNEVISFAGGLPNPVSFPMDEFYASVSDITKEPDSFQYAETEGYGPLREYIAQRYNQRFQLDVTKENILITTGSQQGLDLMGKVLLDKADPVIIEKPGYLGGIQAFSMFEPAYLPIAMDEEGMMPDELEKALKNEKVKFLYTVPNFQNPSGITYSKKRRQEIRTLIDQYEVFLIEDDPYGELRFEGENLPYIGTGHEGSVLFGSFSKTISPGMRVGFICSKNKKLLHHLVTAKQASDLHTSIFTQRAIYEYLIHHDYDHHIEKIRELYKKQSNAMYSAAKKYFPEEVTFTKPEGGMFMWGDLKACKISANEFLEHTKKENIVFVPGDSFYTDKTNSTTFRLNFTNSLVDEITQGIRTMGTILQEMLK